MKEKPLDWIPFVAVKRDDTDEVVNIQIKTVGMRQKNDF